MALSREGKGARLRYGLPLDGTQDTAPEATSAHSACRVRFVTSPQPLQDADEDGIPGQGFFWPSPQAAVLLPEQDGPFLWLQEAQDQGGPFLDVPVDFSAFLDRWLRSVIDPYYWEPTWTSQQADLVQVASALR